MTTAGTTRAQRASRPSAKRNALNTRTARRPRRMGQSLDEPRPVGEHDGEHHARPSNQIRVPSHTAHELGRAGRPRLGPTRLDVALDRGRRENEGGHDLLPGQRQRSPALRVVVHAGHHILPTAYAEGGTEQNRPSRCNRPRALALSDVARSRAVCPPVRVRWRRCSRVPACARRAGAWRGRDIEPAPVVTSNPRRTSARVPSARPRGS